MVYGEARALDAAFPPRRSRSVFQLLPNGGLLNMKSNSRDHDLRAWRTRATDDAVSIRALTLQ